MGDRTKEDYDEHAENDHILTQQPNHPLHLYDNQQWLASHLSPNERYYPLEHSHNYLKYKSNKYLIYTK